MGKKKVLLLVIAVIGVYVLANGGTAPLLASDAAGALRHFLEPVQSSTVLDLFVGVAAVLLLVWACLSNEEGQGFTRTQLLRGIALGSAVMSIVALIVNVSQANHNLYPEFAGLLALISVGHAYVAFGAAMLLLVRSESRRASPLPLFLSGPLAVTTSLLAFCTLYI